jgi:hypothetical protein
MLTKLYTTLLRLYPRKFRQEFAAEMRTVFFDALQAAHREGLWAVAQLCAREICSLPHALVREHWDAGGKKEAGMDQKISAITGKEDAHPVLRETPGGGWWETLLAMLPFLLVLLADALPKLLVETGLLTWEAVGMQVVNTSIIILLAGSFLAGLILAWRQKWPAWSATWYPIFAGAPLALTSALLSLLLGERFNDALNQELVFYLLVPTFLAVLLYSVARSSPLHGLLATLPVLYLLWLPNMEFVPDWIEVVIKVPSVALICLAIAFALHRGDWRAGLYAILAMNLLVGALFSYAGIFHGGSLPFVAPGPNLVEVARSLIPQYLAMGSILIGPLFAWKMRQIGRSGGPAGRAGYHIALAGLLLIILAGLTSLMFKMGSSSGHTIAYYHVPQAAVILGLGIYLLGLFFLYRDSPTTRTRSGWVMRLLLALLPLAIPITFILPFISWKWPMSDLYGVSLLWVLPHGVSLSIGMAWLVLSAWVITREGTAAKPTTAVVRASEAPTPG